MRCPPVLVAAACVAAIFAGAPAAQTVHQVGFGGFGQIQNAINAAANGDIVVIQSGTYAAFTLAKDLTLTAAPGAVVDVAPSVAISNSVTVLQPPTLARIAGLRFRTITLQFGTCQTQVTAGTVHFADCAFESQRFGFVQPSALLVQNARVVMQRCIAIGGGVAAIGSLSGGGCDAMSVANSTVAAVDCLFLGCNLGWDFVGRAGHGVLADGSDVHLANCFAVGGDNAAANPAWPPGDGVHASASRLWIADCELRGGDGHTFGGGSGLANLGTTPALHARSTFVGGGGTPPGPPIAGASAAAPLLGLDGATPAVALGAPWLVRYRGAPATPVLVLWSDTLVVSSLALVSEPLWLPPASFVVVGTGVTDANGILVSGFTVPGTPALLHAPCFVQAFGGLALPLEAAPPVGGTIR